MSHLHRKIKAKRNEIIRVVVVVVAIGSIGIYALTAGHAASSYAAIEAESGSLAGGAKVISDASASNGEAAQFGQSTTSNKVAFVQADDTGTFRGTDAGISTGEYAQILAHNTGIGHTVILVIQTLSPSQTKTISSIDTGMGTFKFVNSYNDVADNEIWICTDTTGAADTIAVNTSTNAWNAFAIEFNQPSTGFANGGGQVTTLNYLDNQSWTLSPGAAGDVALVAVDTADAYNTGPPSPWSFYNHGYWDFDNGTSAAWQVTSSASPVTATWQQDGGLISSQGIVVDF